MKIEIENERPFFAEFAYYLWGEVNYDSDGDCKFPTDRSWNHLYLKNRETKETIEISGENNIFEVQSESIDLEMKVAQFLVDRCNGRLLEGTLVPNGWDYGAALKRTEKIRSDFNSVILKPFDSHLFWGCWKWTGCFATEFNWTGRMIMNSLLVSDTRAVSLCIYWLRAGTSDQEQSEALKYALHLFTGHTFATDEAWLEWYDETGSEKFPEPDLNLWEEELKQENKNVL